MKKLLLLLAIIASVDFAYAQIDGGPRGKKPKKAKGNHSNNRTQLGFGSSSSVFYAVDLGNPPATTLTTTASGEKVAKASIGDQITSATLMTPSGWGSKETFAFVTAGGTPAQPYGHQDQKFLNGNPDYLAQAGFGFGDYTKWASVVGILNINDVSKFDNFSFSMVASRKLGKMGSISVGALHLFADPYKTDAAESFYVAYSQAIRRTKFSYTVGVGSGRFYDNSETDIETGKKEHGTALFGSVSYNIIKNVSVSAEWTGLNLCMSSSVRVKPKWPVLTLGVSDITRSSGDQACLYFGVGQAFSFSKK
jgi:hypothetical protein